MEKDTPESETVPQYQNVAGLDQKKNMPHTYKVFI